MGSENTKHKPRPKSLRPPRCPQNFLLLFPKNWQRVKSSVFHRKTNRNTNIVTRNDDKTCQTWAQLRVALPGCPGAANFHRFFGAAAAATLFRAGLSRLFAAVRLLRVLCAIGFYTFRSCLAVVASTSTFPNTPPPEKQANKDDGSLGTRSSNFLSCQPPWFTAG